MLDIKFYGQNGQEPATIELAEVFYEWLTKSDFPEIGIPQPRQLTIDGEEDKHDLVDLNKGTISNRQRLIDFFKEEIVQESVTMLENLGDYPSKTEYQEQSYKLRKLQEILKHLENKNYVYLERVT